MKNLQQQVKMWSILFNQKLFWPFIVWINCSSDVKKLANSRPFARDTLPLAPNFKSFSWSLKHFFLSQNNFGSKIHFFCLYDCPLVLAIRLASVFSWVCNMNVGQFILQAARLNGKKILPQRDFFIRFNVLKNNQYHIHTLLSFSEGSKVQ